MKHLTKIFNNKIFVSGLILVVSCQLVLASNLIFNAPLALAEDLEPEETTPAEIINPDNSEPIVLENLDPLTGLENESATSTDPLATTTEEIILPPTENPLAESATTTDPTATTTEPIILNNETEEPTATTTEPIILAEENQEILDTVPTVNNDSSSGTGSAINLNMESVPLVGPRILASWQMTTDKNLGLEYLGVDDNDEAGSQFLPSGQYEVNKNLTVCALVVKGSGPAVTESVWADVYYPDVAFATEESANIKGCGQKLNAGLSLNVLSQTQAKELLCNKIKNNNANLPKFSNGMNLDRLCAPDSVLENGQAQIYCQDTSLAYNDPAGNYLVQLLAKDSLENQSPIFNNTFKYLELTAYSVDFDNINYGPVQQYTPKIISGNMTFETPRQANPATIRNVGNTRMSLIVEQNDFGLGMTGNNWNVNYQARVGDSDFINYTPNTPTALTKVIELGETNSLDFGIEVLDFPTELPLSYAGQMLLTAEKVEALTCQVTAP